jgi:Biotin-protein ligase, N terminal
MAESNSLVYAGTGSSHSWTWLADLFESRGIYDVRFSDSQGFTEYLGSGIPRVIVSGGDGFKIATSIGPHGFAHLKGYLHRGGAYVGICAGAYLPLHSSIPPFDEFNLSDTKIENIDCSVPAPGTSPRIAVPYGSCSVVHPIRGEVELDLGGNRLLAPLFGGPIFRQPGRDKVVMSYSGFTRSTDFRLSQDRARSLVLGRPAGIRTTHGKGELLLLGPHLEHPRYRESNEAFLKIVGIESKAQRPDALSKAGPAGDEALAKGIADLKVAVLGLENRSFLVGNKVWDGSRFLELVIAIEKRAHSMDEASASAVLEMLDRVREALISSADGYPEDAVEGPELLVEAARICVDKHFALMRENR